MRQNWIVGFSLFAVSIAFTTFASTAQSALVPWDVRGVSAESAQIANLGKAQDLLDGNTLAHAQVTATFDLLNFDLSGANGASPNFPATSPGFQTNFAEEATAWIKIPAAGAYTFAINHDGGYSLNILGNTSQSTGQGNAKTDFISMTFAQAGAYPVDLIYFQHTGTAQLEFLASPGSYTGYTQTGANFQFVNDVSHGGLAVVTDPGQVAGVTIPEPSALVLLMPTIALLMRRVSRQKMPVR
jgi:hypothetical protein